VTNTHLSNGRYALLERIGEGTFSEVWAVLDTRLEVERAAKIIRAGLDPTLASRLSQEARILAQLDHPGIISVHDVFIEGVDGLDRTVIIMQLCEESIGDHIGRCGPVNEDVALAWFDMLRSGLDAAHAKGITHRDVKPHNILLVNGEAKLADFGLALMGTGVDVVTSTRAIEGTVAFMAEAVRRGDPHTPETDHYSLAASLAYCVTGRFPGDLYRRHTLSSLPKRTRAWVTRVADLEDATPNLTPPTRTVAIGMVLAVLAAWVFFVRDGRGSAEMVPELSETSADCFVRNGEAEVAFYPRRDSLPRGLEEVSDAKAADLDGDGFLDLAFSHNLGAAVRVFWGNGSRPFWGDPSDPPTARFSDVPTTTVISMDIRDEGGARPALVLAGRSKRIDILRFNADRSWALQSVPHTEQVTHISSVDWNEDGYEDLFMISEQRLVLRIARSNGFGLEKTLYPEVLASEITVLSKSPPEIDVFDARFGGHISIRPGDKHPTSLPKKAAPGLSIIVGSGPEKSFHSSLLRHDIAGYHVVVQPVGAGKDSQVYCSTRVDISAPHTPSVHMDLDGDGHSDFVGWNSQPYSTGVYWVSYGK
jgi:serine/threonine protein kinase